MPFARLLPFPRARSRKVRSGFRRKIMLGQEDGAGGRLAASHPVPVVNQAEIEQKFHQEL
jgi:hypothetical protein